MKKYLWLYIFTILIIGISGCDSLFVRDTIGIPSKRPAITYQIRLSTVTDGVPAGFVLYLKRYLFAELSKRKLLGTGDEHPQMVHVLVGYYKVGANMGHAGSMVTIMNGEEMLKDAEVGTSLQKVRSVEDIAKAHAKDIVKFIAEEKRN